MVMMNTRPEPPSPRDANAILEGLMLEYRIHTDDQAIYRYRVLSIAAGIPGELERLIKYHSSEPLVKAREVAQLGQGSVDREESGIAFAPILFALDALLLTRTIRRLCDSRQGSRFRCAQSWCNQYKFNTEFVLLGHLFITCSR
jgi:hypothetical protein